MTSRSLGTVLLFVLVIDALSARPVDRIGSALRTARPASTLNAAPLRTNKVAEQQRHPAYRKPSSSTPPLPSGTDEAYYSLLRLRGGGLQDGADEAYYSLLRLRGGDDRDDAARLAIMSPPKEHVTAVADRAYQPAATCQPVLTHEPTRDSDARYVFIRLDR